MRYEQPYIETSSGKKVHFLEPDPDSIDINDIAYALSHIPRFNGHTSQFVSVAEHCWSGARYIEHGLKLQMLLHDAAEAYLCDIPKPLKDFLPDYRKIEDGMMKAIAAKFGFDYPLSSIVKYYDLVLLSNDAHWLLPSRGNGWSLWRDVKRPIVSPEFKPLCLDSATAKRVFLDLYHDLCGTKTPTRKAA